MSLLKSCIIAFGTYSKIPMPYFEWKEKDMKYTICFFPLVGVADGGVCLLWLWLCHRFGMGELFKATGIIINIFITGGIHIDGYMDTMDALHSYQPKEKKLEILKDAHIGSFAVIMLSVYLMLNAAAVSGINYKAGLLYGMTFVVSRILSGLAVVSFKSAKNEGMLYTFSSAAHKIAVRTLLIAELTAALLVMFYFCGVKSAAVIITMAIVFIYYRYKSYKEFGGITGDLAGWFLCICETAAAVVCAVVSFI